MTEREPTLGVDFASFKDGVYDALIHGRKAPVTELRAGYIRGQPTGYYYNRGYEFGLTIHSDLFLRNDTVNRRGKRNDN